MLQTMPREVSGSRQPDDALRAELDRMSHELEKIKMQMRSSQRLVSLGLAAAMLAHEYNNQMTPVMGYARSAIDSDDVEFMRKALRLTLKHCTTVTAMSDRILGLADQSGRSVGRVHLRTAVEEGLASLGRDPAKDAIRVTLDVPDELHVQADPRQLQQVLFNLFVNAREAMSPGGGTLAVTAAHDGPGHIRIDVRDTGVGIEAPDLANVFEPFVSTKSSDGSGKTRKTRGLGLAICRDIVADHDAAIAVQSERGAGTTFTIRWPAMS